MADDISDKAVLVPAPSASHHAHAQRPPSQLTHAQRPTRRRHELLAVLVACLAPLSGGMAHGFSSPAIPDLQRPRNQGGLDLNAEQISWFASFLAIGAILGGPTASLILDRMGRKFSLMASALPLTLGWLFIVMATEYTVWSLYIGRLVVGIGMGMGTAIAPVYIAEVASVELRGMLGSFFQTCIMLGIMFSFILSIGLNYLLLASVCSIVATVLTLLALFVPETPRWLIRAGEKNVARKALLWLHCESTNTQDKHIDQELDKLVSEIQTADEFQITSIFKDKLVRRAMILSILLMVFQQFSGMNAVAFYAEPILLKAGFSNMASLLSVLLAAIVSLGTFVSSFLMDKLGRKKMLIISGIIMTISCLTFATYWILVQRENSSQSDVSMRSLALFSLCLYVAGFSAGWGPAPWVIMSEILPNQSRGVGSSIATTANWTCAFVVVKGYVLLEKCITNWGTFLLFAGLNMSAVIFAVVCIPETKGKSLETIERDLRGESESHSTAIEPLAV